MAIIPRYDIHIYSPADILLRVMRSVRSAKYRIAENEVGDFEVSVPWGNGQLPSLLVPPNRVEFWRDGIFSFGGVIRRQQINQEGRHPFYTVSGPQYMAWLADNRVTSATGTGDVVFSSDNLDDVMKAVVRAHVLDTTTNFVCATDSGLSTIVDSYTASGYESCLEALQNIATRAKDTSFDIVRDTDKALRFRTYTPSRGPDKSKGNAAHIKPVLFDMVGGNLQSAEWIRDGNKVVNAVRGGGAGNKAARYVYPASAYLTDAQSILDWGRIEGFIDAGTETTAAVDKKTADELLKQAQPEESASFTISEFGRYTLGIDFDFGTKVTVVWGNILEFTDVIRGIQVTMAEGNNVAQVDINVGDTLTGDSATRASILLGRYLRMVRQNISTVVRR